MKLILDYIIDTYEFDDIKTSDDIYMCNTDVNNKTTFLTFFNKNYIEEFENDGKCNVYAITFDFNDYKKWLRKEKIKTIYDENKI